MQSNVHPSTSFSSDTRRHAYFLGFQFELFQQGGNRLAFALFRRQKHHKIRAFVPNGKRNSI